MLTKLIIRNFKRFDEVEIELSGAVVFIGPNNSGKTTALQALALWDAGCRQWLAKRSGGKSDAAKAVTIGRKDLVALPLPAANALWRDQKVREGYREDGKTKTRNLLIEIILEGSEAGNSWRRGFEFEYVSEEYFYCRPLRSEPSNGLLDLDKLARPAFLPPLGGLALEEPLLLAGRVEVLLGSGRSGEVLRNLCYAVWEREDGGWEQVQQHMRSLFGAQLHAPTLVEAQGLIQLNYTPESGGTSLPITSAGLGMLQTLQLLVFLYWKPGAVLLLDEPDAHLEILRQRQTYQVLVDLARRKGSQVVCASHSEVVLNEAIQRDEVVAFVGKPHKVSASTQVLKALRDYGFEHYVQAEQKGWVLYLEGSTDLSILQAWAKRLKHRATSALERPFVHYLNSNVPSQARMHFSAVREANVKLRGLALFDRLEREPQAEMEALREMAWSRREIENYFASEQVLEAFARGQAVDDLIEASESEARGVQMRESISEVSQALSTLGEDLWSPDRKASEQVLPQILQRYWTKAADHRRLAKGSYYTLIDYQDLSQIDPEVILVLDAIADTAAIEQS